MSLLSRTKLAGLVSILATGATVLGAELAATKETSFGDWKAACDRLPANRSLNGRIAPKELWPLPKFSNFDPALTGFLEQSKTGALAQASQWVGENPAAKGFLNTSSAYFAKPDQPADAIPFQPFAQKLDVPAGSEIFYHADFHGDLHSLIRDLSWLNEHGYLRGFETARTNFYMIFLGDYTDRGSYGVEVLYTLFRLKTANPERVFLTRGNHEEVSLQSRYGFTHEARAKYGAGFDFKKMFRAYDFLPVVIYAGSEGNYIQCNHGGMEPGFSPRRLLEATGPLRFQLLGNLNQQAYMTTHPAWLTDAASREIASRTLRDFKPEDPISPATLGFMWNDFSLFAEQPEFDIDPGRALVYGPQATRFILAHATGPKQKLQAVFRGHQQAPSLNPMMRRLVASQGVFRHWQTNDSMALSRASVDELAKKLEHDESRPIPPGSVWTFNVAPDSIYGEGCSYSFDTFGLLKTAAEFKDWRLQVINVPVAP